MSAREAGRRPRAAVLTAAGALAAALGLVAVWVLGRGAPEEGRAAGPVLPRPDHVVVVVFENKAFEDVLGSGEAPYLDSLAKGGATLTRSYGLTHPSQPNYVQLFSGGMQDVLDNSCYEPGFSSAPNLASELIAAGKTWASFNEGLPARGSTVCEAGRYARKHNPWFAFSNVPVDTARTMDEFPEDFTTLPDVSFVVPDLCHDMHDCPVRAGDTWLKERLGAYATWARTHDSLLVVTFDEDDGLTGNRIPTVLHGGPVVPGSTSDEKYHHYDVLRTLGRLAGLDRHPGQAAAAREITGVWVV
ncbi:alkaline phosphatase family protein [Streptomyces filamentosus]|uniref:alkaline phosphatase family protein n=1 Tax=Streptomyces filamentosus TaxID=67294 RepID=UPI0036ECA595